MVFKQHRQTQLVRQAREHRAQAIRLLHEANALAPVSRLPVEVLGRIFVLVRDAVVSSESYTDVHWTVITLVCGLWNTVALRTPEFWSVISFTGTNTPFALTSLNRAGATPLYITIEQALSSRREGIITMIMSRMERVRELRIALGASCRDMLLRELGFLSKSRAPALESFVFTLVPSYIGTTLPADETDQKVLGMHVLFDGHTPRLRKLDIQMDNPDWLAPALVSPYITDLSITNSLWPRSQERMLEGDVLTRVLGQLRMLERLTIRHALPTAALRDQSKSAFLPHLRSLSLSGTSLTVTNALSCMILPKPASITLDVQILDVRSLHALARWLWEHTNSPDIRGVQSLIFDPSVEGRWVIKAGKTADHLNIMEHNSPDNLWLNLILSFSSEVEGAIFPAFAPVLADTKVVRIVAHEYLRSPSIALQTALCALPVVQRLQLVGNGAAAAFDQSLYRMMEHGRVSMEMPDLQEILLSDAHLVGFSLADWLEIRRDLGFGIAEVSFSGCTHHFSFGTEDTFIDSVRASVGRVEWGDWQSVVL
jgi:hypothetical protein